MKLFVDDLTLSTCGLPQEVVATMASVVDFVIDELETELLMEVSAKKSKVLAGRPAIALAVATRVKSCKLDPVRYAKLLGTDSARDAAEVHRSRRPAWSTSPRVPPDSKCFADSVSTQSRWCVRRDRLPCCTVVR